MKNKKVYIEGHIVGLFTSALEKIGHKILLANGDIVDIDNRFIHKSINPEKVTIPQFVADWYEEHKDNLEYNIWDWMKYNLEPKKKENVIFSQWLGKTVNKPVETLIKMKLYGYEVEKEKRYEVVLCNGQSLKTVYRQGEDRLDFEKVYGDLERFTRKRLEEANFGWVFDCPGIKIKEVEE